MSSDSSSNTNTSTVGKGFSAKDVNIFLQKGNTQGSMKTKGIDRFKPTIKKKFKHDTLTKAGSADFFSGKREESRSTRFSGFLGEFASKDFTAEKLDLLTSSFMQREKQVREGRNLVGRKQLFQERT